MYKFEKLEIWNLSLDFIDEIYDLVKLLPREEEYNLVSQLRRAATSVALNIAEGSTGQSNLEQNRFLGLALRSLVECVAGLRIIKRREYVPDSKLLIRCDNDIERLFAKIQAFRRTLNPSGYSVREDAERFGEIGSNPSGGYFASELSSGFLTEDIVSD